LAAATNFIALVIFLVLLTVEIRSRIALALPSITIVERRVLCVSGVKTLLVLEVEGETVNAPGFVVKAFAVARAAAHRKNFILY
jgi:hypothetical protein